MTLQLRGPTPGALLRAGTGAAASQTSLSARPQGAGEEGRARPQLLVPEGPRCWLAGAGSGGRNWAQGRRFTLLLQPQEMPARGSLLRLAVGACEANLERVRLASAGLESGKCPGGMLVKVQVLYFTEVKVQGQRVARFGVTHVVRGPLRD